MTPVQSVNPQQICEHLLYEEKRYNIEHCIFPSENAVVDRLLRRGVEMKNAYEELHGKLHMYPPTLKLFLGLVLNAAAFWSPDKIQDARAARDELVKTNQQIAGKADELAVLLEQRAELHNTSGFSSDTHYHVCDVIESASQHNYLFESYVQERLGALRREFDLKYWPKLSEFAEALASDAQNAVMTATDPLTAAATSAVRSSKADFIKALFAAIEENTGDHYYQLSRSFKLTDKALASLVNCALDLSPDDLVDDAYIKRFRQREREGAK